METRSYKLPFDFLSEEKGYTVIACAGRYGMRGKWHYLPMKLDNITCKRDGEDADIAELAYPNPQDDEDLDQEVRLDYAKILHGQNPDWILCQFQVTMTGIVLGYYNAKRDVYEEVNLNIAYANVKTELHMKFSVPHADGRADTIYWFHNTFMPRSEERPYPEVWVTLESMGCLSYTTMVFYINDDHDPEALIKYDYVRPDYANVADYIDV